MLFEIPIICFHYVNVSVPIQFSLKTSVLSQLLSDFHKIIGRRCALESSRRGGSNIHPQHMILWKNIRKNHLIILIPTPEFPHFTIC